MITYKGFDKDFKCRDFQYEVGKDYEMPEDGIKVCEKGFHACESPLEVLDYYPILDGNRDNNRFAEVEQSGKIDKEKGSHDKWVTNDDEWLRRVAHEEDEEDEENKD